MPSGMSIVTYAQPAISAIVRPLSGEPLTENLPSTSSMSSGAASRLCAAIALTLSTSLHGRAGDRLAADGQRARAVGAEAERAGAGVAVDDVDHVGRDAEPVGDDLRERRVQALAVRRGARVDGRRAGRVHAHERGLVEARLQADAHRADDARRREAADLHPGREADPAVDALRSQLLLLAAERVEVDVREQLVERAVVVAGVVDDADGHLGREVLLGDEVLAPDLERVHRRARAPAARPSPRSGAWPRAGPRRGWRPCTSCW